MATTKGCKYKDLHYDFVYDGEKWKATLMLDNRALDTSIQ